MAYTSWEELRNEVIKGQNKNMASTQKVTITLPNGVEMSGTQAQMDEVARAYKTDGKTWSITASNPIQYPDGKYYNSNSRGMIKISDMELTHLKRTYAKLNREAVAKLMAMTDKEYITKLTDSFYGDVTLRAIYHELEKRLKPPAAKLWNYSITY